jgi:hypothetical protein
LGSHRGRPAEPSVEVVLGDANALASEAGGESKARSLPARIARRTVGTELLADANPLRRVIDLPVDLEALDGEERKAVDPFIKVAKRLGADKGYVAQNRTAWWSVGLRVPAPILATYMARRPPAFVRNKADARHINIAHGIYPRQPFSETALAALAGHLSRTVGVESGRADAPRRGRGCGVRVEAVVTWWM